MHPSTYWMLPGFGELFISTVIRSVDLLNCFSNIVFPSLLTLTLIAIFYWIMGDSISKRRFSCGKIVIRKHFFPESSSSTRKPCTVHKIIMEARIILVNIFMAIYDYSVYEISFDKFSFIIVATATFLFCIGTLLTDVVTST